MHTASPSPKPDAAAGQARAAVSLATWDQSAEAKALAAGPHRATRRDAFVQVAIMLLVGIILRYGLGHHFLANLVWGLAGVFLLLGTVWLAGYQPVHRGGRWLGNAVGTALIYLLLVPFFFLFILPVALLLRLQGRTRCTVSSAPPGTPTGSPGHPKRATRTSPSSSCARTARLGWRCAMSAVWIPIGRPGTNRHEHLGYLSLLS